MWTVAASTALAAAVVAGPNPCDQIRPSSAAADVQPAVVLCMNLLRTDVAWARQKVENDRKAAADKKKQAQGLSPKAALLRIDEAAQQMSEAAEPLRPAVADFADAVDETARSLRMTVIDVLGLLGASTAPPPPPPPCTTDPWAWRFDAHLQACTKGERSLATPEDTVAYTSRAYVHQRLLVRLLDEKRADISALDAARDLDGEMRGLMALLGLASPSNDECAPYVLKSGYRRASKRGDSRVVTGCIVRLEADVRWAMAAFDAAQAEAKGALTGDATVKKAVGRIVAAAAVVTEAVKDPARKDDVKEALAGIQKAAGQASAVLSPAEPAAGPSAAEPLPVYCPDAWLSFDSAIQGCSPAKGRELIGVPLADYVNQAHSTLGRLYGWQHRLLKKDEEDPSRYPAPLPLIDPQRAPGREAIHLTHSLMARMDLRRPFSAIFVPAVAFASTGTQAPAVAPSTSPSPSPAPAAAAGASTATESETPVLGYVSFESMHWTPREGQSFDFAGTGRFGFQPIFDMVVPDGAEPSTAPVPTYRNAFVWDVGVRANHTITGRVGEVGFAARVGQTLPTDDLTLVKVGKDADKQALIARSEAAGAKWYYEASFRAAIFGDRFDAAHERNVLDPMLDICFGLRWDDRLRHRSDLTGFTRPEDRYFFRFAINRLPVLKGGDTFRVSFAVEHEWARHAGSLTSGNKLMLQGHLDLLSAFGGKS